MVTAALLEAHGLLPCFADGTLATTPSGVDLSLMPDSITTVLGEDRQQVAAWLRCLAGLVEPCAGQVSVAGEDLFRLSKSAWQRMRTRIAYLNRDSSLLSVLSMLENIIQPALYHKLAGRDELLAEAHRLLDEIGPVDRDQLQQLPAHIDQQCYAQALIVRALLLRPQIIILDDFFSRYDRQAANAMLQYIYLKAGQQGMAALVYDHDMELLMDKTHRHLFIAGDKLLQFDSREALLAADNQQLQALLHNHGVDTHGR